LQQRVARFEGIDQLLLVVHGRNGLFDPKLDFFRHRPARSMIGDLQVGGGIAHVVDGAHQRIIIAKESGPSPQHVALQGGIVEDQLAQRVERALVQGNIGGRTLDQEIGQEQHQAGDRRRKQARRPHGDTRPDGVARDCP
jgi:hypothetical protein